mmetsp:Transcript_31703/g.106804  ORF Transcript_31703/g.106804 Transcript_31703/m.106804 type:complete len:119 (+) Transcript_31703:81-437(+)
MPRDSAGPPDGVDLLAGVHGRIRTIFEAEDEPGPAAAPAVEFAGPAVVLVTSKQYLFLALNLLASIGFLMIVYRDYKASRVQVADEELLAQVTVDKRSKRLKGAERKAAKGAAGRKTD